MAYITGTSANAAAFWTLLLNFLKTNSTLVTEGQNWSQVWANGDSSQVLLDGPGLSSTEHIYVGFRYHANETTDEHTIFLSGYTGYLSGATDLTQHFGRSAEVAFFLDNNPMQYWIVGSGRRFIVAVKVSTIYESAYAGLFLPYSPPTNYPYPLFVGGTKGYKDLATNNWRSVEAGHKAWFNPYRSNPLGLDDVPTSAYMIDALGSAWYPVVNQGYRDDLNIAHMLPGYAGQENPWGADGVGNWGAVEPGNAGADFMGYAPAFSKTRHTLDGGYTLHPLSLVQATPLVVNWGVMDGIYAVPGAGNSAENTITIAGDTYLVIPDTFRTNNSDYVAMKLG